MAQKSRPNESKEQTYKLDVDLPAVEKGTLKQEVYNQVNIIVSPEGKIWLQMSNDSSDKWSNKTMRMELLDKVAKEYNDRHPDQVSFTQRQKEAFAAQSVFGVPLSQMGKFLDLYSRDGGEEIMEKWMNGEFEDDSMLSGIPISWECNEDNPNEFQLWIKAIRQTNNDNLKQTLRDGTGLAIKADKNTSYETIRMVMENLQAIKQNKFTFLTTLKSE